uniref:Uncharacterized protein n=1 Tax=Panagrolaimus davidi TaxID=227884 RepID=A0A914PFA1_9BILA
MVLLTGNKIGVPLAVFAIVQDKRISAEFHLSEGNAKEANVLGMAALRKLKAFVGDLDWNIGKFKLVKN